MNAVSDRHAYCRAVEAYLCQKNDGHLIRIVGPAFDRVLAWADQGIPLKVAQQGIDRYFERYYRKGPRRRPVRVEFCDADVLDAFDEWRRAVGVSVVATDPADGPLVEEPQPAAPRPRRSLRTHIEALIARLTVLRGSDRLGATAGPAIDGAIRSVEALLVRAGTARGDERQAVLEALRAAEQSFLADLLDTLPAGERAALEAEARSELEPFRARMAPQAHADAVEGARRRQVRQRCGVPEFGL